MQNATLDRLNPDLLSNLTKIAEQAQAAKPAASETSAVTGPGNPYDQSHFEVAPQPKHVPAWQSVPGIDSHGQLARDMRNYLPGFAITDGETHLLILPFVRDDNTRFTRVGSFDPRTRTYGMLGTYNGVNAVVGDGRYVYLAANNQLHRIDHLGFDGEQKWQLEGVGGTTPMTFAGGQLYSFGSDGNIRAFDPQTGTQREVGSFPEGRENGTVKHVKVDGVDKFYLVGGTDIDRSRRLGRGRKTYSDVLVFELRCGKMKQTGTLEMKNGTYRSPRANPSIVQIDDDRIMIANGRTAGTHGWNTPPEVVHEIDTRQDKIRSGSKFRYPDNQYGQYGDQGTAIEGLDNYLYYFRGVGEAGVWSRPTCDKLAGDVHITLNILKGIIGNDIDLSRQTNIDLLANMVQEVSSYTENNSLEVDARQNNVGLVNKLRQKIGAALGR